MLKKYVEGEWKSKHDQKQAPGDYNIVRLMTIAKDGTDGNNKFVNSPILERVKLGKTTT